MSNHEFDVAIVGAGMVGAATACLLLRKGFSVALVEPHDPPHFDESAAVGLRVSAISPGSKSILGHAGAWRIISSRRHCPYRRMHVEESGAGEQAELDFAAAEFGMDELGTIVENDSIAEALWQVLGARQTAGDALRVESAAAFEGLEVSPRGVEINLSNGAQITARLLIGADGPRSAVRTAAGIDQKVWHYGQKGIVCVVQTRRPNPGVAWQRFMEGGPLAFLPLSDGGSSIVWTRPGTQVEKLLGMSGSDFAVKLEQASGGWLGTMESCGPRAAFDLTMRLSEQYAGRRCALVGDAAHVVHPMAGQGVNLGFLDAAALVEVLSDAGDDWAEEAVLEKALQRYQRWRRSDAEVMAYGIHGIHALFTPPSLGPLRRLGLKLVGRSWPAREAFLRRAAGLHADAPMLARKGSE